MSIWQKMSGLATVQNACGQGCTMSALTFYHFPGARSNVCVVALKQARLDYKLRLVDISIGEQTSGSYLEIVPHGLVPLCVAQRDC
jgi:hypothetical protein